MRLLHDSLRSNGADPPNYTLAAPARFVRGQVEPPTQRGDVCIGELGGGGGACTSRGVVETFDVSMIGSSVDVEGHFVL